MIDNQIKQKETDDKLTVKDPVKDDEPERNKYFCPLKECDKIPEIVNAVSEIGKIILRCGKYNKLIYLDVDDYFKILDKEKTQIDKNDTNYCISIDDKINSKQDKKNILIDIKSNSNKGNENNLIDNESIKQDSDNNLIDNEKNSKKGGANSKNSSKENFNSRYVLLAKNKDLCNIIRALNQLVDTQEKHPENYLHNKNVLNIVEYIDKENLEITYNNQKYSTYEIIEEMESKEKEEEQAIQKLKEYLVYFDRKKHINKEELHLDLSWPKNKKDKKGNNLYPPLKNEGFKLITQIRFKNLIEINVADNNIEDISSLDNMLLPHLEIINLRNNLIKNIQPVANLQSTYLSEIYLQNNKINDLSPFLNSKFDYLEIFRVDNNELAIKNESFPAFKERYKNSLYYEALDWNNFIEEYHCYELGNNFNSNEFAKLVKLDLGSRRCGDKILLDLRPLIIYPNNLKELILDDNKLQNISLLNRMRFPNLEKLDLSLNLITNLRFIKKLSKTSKNLKALFLNDNKINDISPLIAYKEVKEVKNNNNEDNEIKEEDKEVNKNKEMKKEEKKEGEKVEKVEGIIFEKLQVLTLDNNCLDKKDKKTKEILSKLNNIEQLTIDCELEPEGNQQESRQQQQQQQNPNNNNDNNN